MTNLTEHTLDAQPRLDHLVVLADSLAEGAAWCEATLGVTPGPGGEHPLFGTHNRLLALGGNAYPLAYLEIIAINSEAARAGTTSASDPKYPQSRWFDMDDATLQASVRTHGPRLIHWVARVPDVQAACGALAAQGLDRGDVLRASRMTPAGLLSWQISVRPDGQRLMGGCLPTLIEWGAVHPAASMPASGLALESLTLRHPQAHVLGRACAAVGVEGVQVVTGAVAELEAMLSTPRGMVALSSQAA